tara:strand:- start:2566 stop:2829 length:264 start_codon:yes stop_codon:yes gene_type:complete
MEDIFKQVLVGVLIAAIAGVWAFAATRASTASVISVSEELKALEVELETDIDNIDSNIDEIKETFHRAMIEQTEFRAQVREKLQITN